MGEPFRRRVFWILILNTVLILIPLSGFYFIQLGSNQALQQRAMILKNCNESITKIVRYVTSTEAINTVPVLAPYQRVILIGPREEADSLWQENPGFQWRLTPFDALLRLFPKWNEKPDLEREEIVSRLSKYFSLGEGKTGIINYRYLYSVLPIEWGGGRGVSIFLFDKSDLMQTDRLNKIILAFVTLLSALIAALVSYVYYRLFMRPLFVLTSQARALASQGSVGLFSLRKRKDEIGQLSQAFYQSTQDLIGRKEAVENFTSDVLHELKNPLTAIRNGVEILQEANRIRGNLEAQELLNLISRETGRIDKLLYDIKELSVYQEEPSTTESCVPQELILEIAALYQDRGIITEIHADPDHILPLPREKLGCIVKNLLDNALDFSPVVGSVTVAYTQDSWGRARGGVLTVSDQGKGIPADEKSRIFSRFYSHRTGDAAKGLHSGLGLAIVAGILKTYRATIDCYDNIPSGCRFVVTFTDTH